MSEESMLQKKLKGRYLSIFSDGTLREKVDKNHPDAEEREYELKDGTKGSKWEVVYKSLIGKITSVWFREGDYGQQMFVEFTGKEDDQLTVAIPTQSNFATDFMKKLPNMDFEKTYFFLPYSFIPEDSDKQRRGVSLKHGDVKVESYFYDADKKESKNDFPDPEGDKSEYSKDDWKIYFMKVKKFLVDYTEKNICPKFPERASEAKGVEHYPTAEEEGIKPEDIPF